MSSIQQMMLIAGGVAPATLRLPFQDTVDTVVYANTGTLGAASYSGVPATGSFAPFIKTSGPFAKAVRIPATAVTVSIPRLTNAWQTQLDPDNGTFSVSVELNLDLVFVGAPGLMCTLFRFRNGSNRYVEVGVSAVGAGGPPSSITYFVQWDTLGGTDYLTGSNVVGFGNHKVTLQVRPSGASSTVRLYVNSGLDITGTIGAPAGGADSSVFEFGRFDMSFGWAKDLILFPNGSLTP